MVNFNMGLNFLYGWLMSPFSLESARSHGGVYSVPTRTAFYGYMVAAMVCHDIWFYHAHRFDKLWCRVMLVVKLGWVDIDIHL